jgi:hypothetical protein
LTPPPALDAHADGKEDNKPGQENPGPNATEGKDQLLFPIGRR